MKKISSIVIMAVLSTTICMAQENLKDVIYLKNGDVVKGTIIEFTPRESVKIKTADGSIFTNKLDDITKFAREDPAIALPKSVPVPQMAAVAPPREPRARAPRPVVDLKRFISTVQIGGAMAEFITSFSADYVARFQIMPELSIGVGAGVGTTLIQEAWDQPFITVPTFASLRGTFLRTKVSPFVSADIGGVGIFSTGGGGASYQFYFNPTAGVQIRTRAHRSISIGLGYLYMGLGTDQGCIRVGFNL